MVDALQGQEAQVVAEEKNAVSQRHGIWACSLHPTSGPGSVRPQGWLSGWPPTVTRPHILLVNSTSACMT